MPRLIESHSFSFAQMYTNVVLNSQEVAVNLSDGVVHIGREAIKWMGQRTRLHHLRELINSALCGFNVKSSGISLLGLILIWLSIAPTPLSVSALQASLPSIFHRLQFPSPSITVTSTDVSKCLSKLSGFVTVDHGNTLVYLSSEAVREEILNSCTTSSALSAFQRNINGQVAVYCLEYLMNLGFQVPNLETEASVDTLLRQHHFLAHAATALRTYCRDFLKSAMPSLPVLDVPRVTELSLTPDPKIVGEHISYHMITTGTRAAEIPSPSGPLDPEDELRLLSMINDFFDHNSATLSILVHVYLSEELFMTSSIDTWQGLHSWVSSMPKLHRMSKLGFVKLVYDEKLILSSDVNEADKRGRTPLHDAVLGGFKDDVHILLAKGAHPNQRDNSQGTPLSYAMRGNDEIFVLLFEEFCEKYYRMDPANTHRSTLANHYARCINTNKATSSQLLDLALIYAIEKAKIGVVTLLLDEGAKPDCLDDEHIPALHRAIRLIGESSASAKAEDIVALLLMRGADPSIKSKDEKGEPSLHVAARLGAVELVRRLVGYGADPCSQDSQGQSVLFAVVEAPIEESYKDYLLRWLLLRGAKVEQMDEDGRRVLHLAASGGMQRVIFRLLKGVGALWDPRDNTGKSPSDYARDAGHERAAAVLESVGGGDDYNCYT
jgi:ankyrin repeat protein